MKFNPKLVFGFAAFALVSGLVGCGGGDANVTPKIVAAASTRALVSMDNLSTPFERWVAPAVAPNLLRTTQQIGQTTATSLTSLQYYIQSIQLCENITTSGSGYSDTTGCVTLYENADSQEVSLYNSYTITEATADTNANHFIDFLSAEGRAKLEVSQAISSGTYNYALINFMRPIKIKAEFKDPSGTLIHRTKAGGTIVDRGTDSGGREMEAVKPSGTNAGDAEVMTYMLNNGGTWFPLLKPFVIASGESVLLDFAFNPENFATSLEQTSCSEPSVSGPYVWDVANCVTFDMPYAKMSPIPRKAGERTKKEVYLITDYTNTGSSKSDFRIELYYNSADADKSIRGVDGAVVMKSGATESAGNVIQTYKISEASNVVTFYGYNSATGNMDAQTLTGLTRGADGNVTISCVYTGGPCATAGDTVTLAYEYVGDVTLPE